LSRSSSPRRFAKPEWGATDLDQEPISDSQFRIDAIMKARRHAHDPIPALGRLDARSKVVIDEG